MSGQDDYFYDEDNLEDYHLSKVKDSITAVVTGAQEKRRGQRKASPPVEEDLHPSSDEDSLMESEEEDEESAAKALSDDASGTTTQMNIDPSNEKAKKRVKRDQPIPKIDSDLLQGPNGLFYLADRGPRLSLKHVDQVKNFQSLMLFYQAWTHKLFPKLKHEAVVDRVEKICQSKEMKVSRWYINIMTFLLFEEVDLFYR